jgi:hypothetical protein
MRQQCTDHTSKARVPVVGQVTTCVLHVSRDLVKRQSAECCCKSSRARAFRAVRSIRTLEEEMLDNRMWLRRGVAPLLLVSHGAMAQPVPTVPAVPAVPTVREVQFGLQVRSTTDFVCDAVVEVQGQQLRNMEYCAFGGTVWVPATGTVQVVVSHPDFVDDTWSYGVEPYGLVQHLGTLMVRRAGQPYFLQEGRRWPIDAAREEDIPYWGVTNLTSDEDVAELAAIVGGLARRYDLTVSEPGGQCLGSMGECGAFAFELTSNTQLSTSRRTSLLTELRAQPAFMAVGPRVGEQMVLSNHLEVAFQPTLGVDEILGWLQERGLHGSVSPRVPKTAYFVLPLGIGLGAVRAAERLERDPSVVSVTNVLGGIDLDG